MAFAKTVPTSYNVDANYHKITEAHIDYTNGNIRVVVAGWKNRADRNNNVTPLCANVMVIDGADYVFTGNEPSRAEIYGKLKSIVKQIQGPVGPINVPSMWADAVDD